MNQNERLDTLLQALISESEEYKSLHTGADDEYKKVLLRSLMNVRPPMPLAEKVLKITKDVISENKLTCLMITHNMHNALELGNRTLMMNQGNIIYDVRGEEREGLTVGDLLERFKTKVGEELDNDRMLLS